VKWFHFGPDQACFIFLDVVAVRLNDSGPGAVSRITRDSVLGIVRSLSRSTGKEGTPFTYSKDTIRLETSLKHCACATSWAAQVELTGLLPTEPGDETCE
jgi:hypothetical protein